MGDAGVRLLEAKRGFSGMHVQETGNRETCLRRFFLFPIYAYSRIIPTNCTDLYSLYYLPSPPSDLPPTLLSPVLAEKKKKQNSVPDTFRPVKRAAISARYNIALRWPNASGWYSSCT